MNMNRQTHIAFVVTAVCFAACVPLETVASVADQSGQAVSGAVQNNGGAATPTDATGAVLDIAVWVLAALGLLPVSRGVAMAKPFIVGLADMIFGKKKKTDTTTQQ